MSAISKAWPDTATLRQAAERAGFGVDISATTGVTYVWLPPGHEKAVTAHMNEAVAMRFTYAVHGLKEIMDAEDAGVTPGPVSAPARRRASGPA